MKLETKNKLISLFERGREIHTMLDLTPRDKYLLLLSTIDPEVRKLTNDGVKFSPAVGECEYVTTIVNYLRKVEVYIDNIKITPELSKAEQIIIINKALSTHTPVVHTELYSFGGAVNGMQSLMVGDISIVHFTSSDSSSKIIYVKGGGVSLGLFISRFFDPELNQLFKRLDALLAMYKVGMRDV